MAGTKVISNTPMNMEIMNGKLALARVMISNFAILHATNKFCPTGGVRKPMHKVISVSMPK